MTVYRHRGLSSHKHRSHKPQVSVYCGTWWCASWVTGIATNRRFCVSSAVEIGFCVQLKVCGLWMDNYFMDTTSYVDGKCGEGEFYDWTSFSVFCDCFPACIWMFMLNVCCLTHLLCRAETRVRDWCASAYAVAKQLSNFRFSESQSWTDICHQYSLHTITWILCNVKLTLWCPVQIVLFFRN